MTIHSEWTKILYQECPDAFIDNFNPLHYDKVNVGVIDGHLQLMCLNECMISWDSFIKNMYINPIQKLYASGCHTVVLCFDAYEYVPVYKNMTQIKRCSKTKVIPFASTQSLPHKIPNEAIKYLMNRTFKLKVIQMLCEKIPQILEIKKGNTFIMDYKKVVMYKALTQNHLGTEMEEQCERYPLNPVPISLPELEHMGESDVKFLRYVEKFGNALVHAIDGDYMIIALLYYCKHGINPENKIYLYRQKQKWGDSIHDDEYETDDKIHSVKKRKLNGEIAEDVQRGLFNKKNKCWVDMQLIYATLLDCFRQSLRTDSMNLSCKNPLLIQENEGAEMDIDFIETEHDYMKSVVFLMLSAGTDFSRQLPLIGPKRLWENLPHISYYLMIAMKNRDMEMIQNVVWGKLYKIIFQRHVQATSNTWNRICSDLQHSSLSKNTKTKLPSSLQIQVTIKNILWVISYWETVNGSIPTPLDGKNGFVQSSSNGKIIFEDMEYSE